MIPLTLAMRLDQAKKGKTPVRRRLPPIDTKKTASVPVPKSDAQRPRPVNSLRSHSPVNNADAVFPYHIDEENEIIYKRANDGTWTQGVLSVVEREHNPGKLARCAEVPQTLEFNYDWTLTKIAAECRDVSF